MKLKQNAVDLTDLALGIVVLGLVVSIGVNILFNIRDGSLTDLDIITTTNESLSFSANKAYLTNKWGISVSKIANQTLGTAIDTGNYSVSVSTVDGAITITNTTSYNQPWYATYTWYNTSRADYALANDAGVGLTEYGNWFSTIVIVGIAGVILALIFLAFGKGGRVESAGGTY